VVADGARWSRAAAVTSTVKDACRPAAEAITTTLPASVGAVRTPAAEIVPRDADHETVAPDTTLPYASVKLAVNVVVAPAATLADPEIATAEAGPATIVTSTVDETPPCETVSVSVPVVVGAEYCTMRPSEERGRPPDHDNVPAEITFPFVSWRDATRVDVDPAGTDRLVGLTTIRAGAAGTIVTETVAAAEPAVTVTVPVPTAVAAVSTPVDAIVPSEELADHERASPEIAFPKRSRGVPVKASVPPAATVAEPGETSIRLTAPGTTVTVTRTVRPPDATDKVPEPAA